ncbi:hypothetical protein HXX76_000918 [Chlamydomonas incerta]|uniref:F-box domain-containing protein n=1 Tax=Chlamydomonas incerta TaxID=51695 RepID=A0A836B358_CHLIN|nr:hypothetical protein HXX76_000918 [Chlamydomonas incerta]|eukprot:KAG2446330.1 hypothetical protein HXX76_000918 [Chlamydomonas incerta]
MPGLRVRISGDAIPAEVLLLVLSELRDTADCVRAALVCRHWMSVVGLSNELWFEMQSRDWGLGGGAGAGSGGCPSSVQGAAGVGRGGGGGGGGKGGGGAAPNGTWHRAPYAGRPLLLPPPGAGHVRSLMLQYKTTCTLTQVAVRFMVLRKGFEYIVEAAASLWLAAQQAAAATAVAEGGAAQQHQQQPSGPDGGGGGGIGGESSSDTPAQQAGEMEPASGTRSDGGGGGGGGSGGGGGGGGSKRRRITHVDGRFNAVKVQQMAGKLFAGSSSSSSCGPGGGGSSSAGGSGGSSGATANWLLLYEGVAALMTSRCDEVRDELATEAALQAARAAAAEASGAAATRAAGAAAAAAAATATAAGVCAAAQAAPGGSCGNGDRGAAGSRAGRGGGSGVSFRGEVVYGGSSYADQFAELLRRGDTRAALALGAQERAAAAAARRRQAAGGAGGGGVGGCAKTEAMEVAAGAAAAEVEAEAEEEEEAGELEEPEMREVIESAGDDATATAPPPPIVAEGLLLWRLLLRCWGVYRRWLEVLVVWLGPLGARVEAERQLAGAAAAHGEAPLAPPHLTNKGLMAFRSQVLLAYPIRRPLQAAALWLAARAALGDEGPMAMSVAAAPGPPAAATAALGGCGPGSRAEAGPLGAANAAAGAGGAGGSGGGGLLTAAERWGGPYSGYWLSEEHFKLLTSIRKVLTELASVPDDTTQPAHLHTGAKMRRCFGDLLGPTGGAGGRGWGRGGRSRLLLGGGGAVPGTALPGWGGVRGPGSRPVE